jgi:hypothetical protein
MECCRLVICNTASILRLLQTSSSLFTIVSITVNNASSTFIRGYSSRPSGNTGGDMYRARAGHVCVLKRNCHVRRVKRVRSMNDFVKVIGECDICA